ncbi:MAG: methionine--tRNA ligase subunit beta, partial [Gemmatimonadota bacterium]|nr:methionine--tRNA ligase subunit beta [Gemmatimonadota bacterium]
GTLESLDLSMQGYIIKIAEEVGNYIDTFRFRQAADTFGEFTRFCNKYFNDKAPWKTRKEEPGTCATTLNLCAQACYAISVVMWPVMPFSAEKLWAQLGLSTDWKDHPWDQDFIAEKNLPAGHRLGKVEVLFPKIEDSLIDEQIAALEKAKAASSGKAAVEKEVEQAETIDFDQFAAVDIRVAQVKAAEEVPKSKRLLKLTLDVGELGERTVAAGIREHYEAGELVGRKVLIVVNLEPRKVMGVTSQGMILAACTAAGQELGLTTVDPTKDLPPGTRIS